MSSKTAEDFHISYFKYKFKSPPLFRAKTGRTRTGAAETLGLAIFRGRVDFPVDVLGSTFKLEGGPRLGERGTRRRRGLSNAQSWRRRRPWSHEHLVNAGVRNPTHTRLTLDRRPALNRRSAP